MYSILSHFLSGRQALNLGIFNQTSKRIEIDGRAELQKDLRIQRRKFFCHFLVNRVELERRRDEQNVNI